MADPIDREYLLECIEQEINIKNLLMEKALKLKCFTTRAYLKCERDAYQELACKIQALPSAERKKAKLLNANPVGKCSACGWLIDYRDEFNFCPKCGAQMEVE